MCGICDVSLDALKIHDTFVSMTNKETQLEEQIRLTQAVIPEGYKIAKDTLPEQVALMVSGLYAYSKDRESLLEEIRGLERTLAEIPST